MDAEPLTIPGQILRQAQRAPEATAVEAGPDRMSYRALVASAAALADHLGEIGVQRGDVVAVALPRGTALVAALLGVQLAGAGYLPLDPEHPADRLTTILTDAGVPIAVVADAAALPGVHVPVRVRLDDIAVLPSAEPSPTSAPGPDDIAYLIYTSGSTGQPKGVQVDHRSLANLIGCLRERLALPADVRLPAVTTVAFDIAALELFLPLTSGGRVVVASPDQAADPERLRALLEQTEVSVMQATPVTWQLLLEAGWSPPPGFTVLCGGERLRPELAQRLQTDAAVLWDLYGPTETTIWSSTTRYQHGCLPEFAPIAETSVHVLDDRLTPVPDGSTGELYLGGTGLAVGYRGRAGLTAGRFVANPTATGTRLYRTGDLARRDSDGRLQILGRTDDQVKIRGFRVEPGEIENALGAHPTVAAAAVVAVRDGGGELRLVAHVRPADPADPPEPRQLQRHLAKTLPAYMVPTRIILLDRFPLTPNGKLDRAGLARTSETSAEPAPAEPASGEGRDATIERVSAVLAAVLERDELGPHEDFFALGGDSLRAVQAILRLNEELSTQVSINALFETRTAYGLAALLTGDAEPLPTLNARPADLPARLSGAQWRYWLHQQTAPDSVAHNQAVVLRLPEPLDADALQASLAELLQRHQTLRTRFELRSGQPAPVAEELDPRITVECGDPRAVLEAMLAQPFDLTAPPIRWRTARPPDGPEGTWFLMVLHEIAADDRSREVVASQLRAGYRGRTVPAPTLRYTDYAHWQRELAGSSAARRHLEYWRNALADLDPAELRLDRERPPVRDWRGDAVEFSLPPKIVEALSSLAFDRDTTLPVALVSALCAVLAEGHLTGSELTLGVPVVGRDQPQLTDLVGSFESTAVLRVRLGAPGQQATPATTYEQVLLQVREAGLAAFGRAMPAWEDIVAAAGGARPTEPGRHPLFDVAFTPHGVGEPVGFVVPHAPGAWVDLRLDTTERADGGLDGAFCYAVQLFDRSTVQQLSADYRRFVCEVASNPSRPVRWETAQSKVPEGASVG